ncbi:MAG: glycosyltransferase family 4 protein [Deltaproteobacteria bacterium]|nr:glycosyltransferase family 4 protein [Deltaproteobacteria bacterium]
MNVLMLNHNVIWRSTFFRAFYFGRELALRGHQVTLATIAPKERLRAEERLLEGVRVVETPDLGVGLARTGWDPWDALFRCARFAREPFDVVHGFDCRPVVLLPSLALRLGRRVPWVSDWADWWGRGGAISERKSWIGRVAFAPFETFLEERFRRFARHVTVTSRKLEQRALDLGLRRDRVHYLPSGANVRTVPVLDRAACRRELDLPATAPIACFVGFVQYDLELAIRAFAVARQRVPESRLLVVGPRNPHAEALVERLELTSAVHAVGTQPFERVPLYLGASDVLLMPCSDNLMNQARGPIKLGDYLAAGRAVLANPVGDMVEIFERDKVGLLAPASPEGYGRAMAELLTDPQRCATLGERARAVAEEKYAWALLTPRLEAIYDRALAGF